MRTYTPHERASELDLGEIVMALEQLSNNKTPYKDEVTIELLKTRGIYLSVVLSKLYNSVIRIGTTP